MKTRIAALAAILGLVASVMWLGLTSTSSIASAEESGLPGMCNGRTDPNVVLHAHANGSLIKNAPKYILNISTDSVGAPSGTLVVRQGKDRLLVEEWCRLWMHRPGDLPQGDGECEGDNPDHETGEGTINAHAVGIGWHQGKQVLVRTDVRSDEEGQLFFRVRYRVLGEHHEETLAVEDGCDDDSWTRIPAEGWLPLAQLAVHIDD